MGAHRLLDLQPSRDSLLVWLKQHGSNICLVAAEVLEWTKTSSTVSLSSPSATLMAAVSLLNNRLGRDAAVSTLVQLLLEGRFTFKTYRSLFFRPPRTYDDDDENDVGDDEDKGLSLIHI